MPYIVYGHDYEDYHFGGVFTNRNLAREAMKQLASNDSLYGTWCLARHPSNKLVELGSDTDMFLLEYMHPKHSDKIFTYDYEQEERERKERLQRRKEEQAKEEENRRNNPWLPKRRRA